MKQNLAILILTLGLFATLSQPLAETNQTEPHAVIITNDQFVTGSGANAFWLNVLSPSSLRVSPIGANRKKYSFAPKASYIEGSGIAPQSLFPKDKLTSNLIRNSQNEHLIGHNHQPRLFHFINTHLDNRRQLEPIKAPAVWQARMGYMRKLLPGLHADPLINFQLRKFQYNNTTYLIWHTETPAFSFESENGETVVMSYKSVLITDSKFQQPVLLAKRYWGQVVSPTGKLQPFHGQKVTIGLEGSGNQTLLPLAKIAEVSSVLSSFQRVVPVRPTGQQTLHAAPPSWLSKVRSVAFVLELTTAVEAEGRSNIFGVVSAILFVDEFLVKPAVNKINKRLGNDNHYDGIVAEVGGEVAEAGARIYNKVFDAGLTERDFEKIEAGGEIAGATASLLLPGKAVAKAASKVVGKKIGKDAAKGIGKSVGELIGGRSGGTVGGWVDKGKKLYDANENYKKAKKLAREDNSPPPLPDFLKEKPSKEPSPILQSSDNQTTKGEVPPAKDFATLPSLFPQPVANKTNQSNQSNYSGSGFASRFAKATQKPSPSNQNVSSQDPLNSRLAVANNITTNLNNQLANFAPASTGGFQDVSILLPLRFRVFDSGNLEDGDRVTLSVRSLSGQNLGPQNLTLTFAGQTFAPLVSEGPVEVSLTALNEGTAPPNTGGLNIFSTVTSGPKNQNFSLSTGDKGVLRITASE